MRLEPETQIQGENTRYSSTGKAPWFRLVNAEMFRSRWIRIRYSSGLFDEVVRPLIRFRLKTGAEVTLPMNGALLGSAVWLGHVPSATEVVSISPTNHPGPFSFRIDSVELVSMVTLVIKGLWRDPRMTLTATGAWLIGSRDEARHCLLFALGGTKLAEYETWKDHRCRQPELDGLDSVDWRDAPAVRFVIRLDGSLAAGAETFASLAGQAYRTWTLHAIAGSDTDLTRHYRELSAKDNRFCQISETTELRSTFAADDLVSRLTIGEHLPATATGAIASAALRSPDTEGFYGDEELDPDSSLAVWLKPDWSPIAEQAWDAGSAMFVRRAALEATGCFTAADLLQKETLSPNSQVKHVRRIVRRSTVTRSAEGHDRGAPTKVTPIVEIIIPSRDRGALLRKCVSSLRKTDYPSFRVTIVDNGTVETDALELLADLQKSSSHQVLNAPGAFNFSALCNLGAAQTDAKVLVFLNNDVEVQSSDWLKRLVHYAMRHDVGAVGAKLLYPDGRIQHTGVVLGLGEMAGHLYRGTRSIDDPELRYAHEVSAVTGAVLAVERAKFIAAGQFDAVRFPILYNDTDLCLRLARMGWRTILEPHAVLIHHESASRGRPVDPFTRHRSERTAFQELWLDWIRDDPYFHPALSIYSYEPELG